MGGGNPNSSTWRPLLKRSQINKQQASDGDRGGAIGDRGETPCRYELHRPATAWGVCVQPASRFAILTGSSSPRSCSLVLP